MDYMSENFFICPDRRCFICPKCMSRYIEFIENEIKNSKEKTLDDIKKLQEIITIPISIDGLHIVGYEDIQIIKIDKLKEFKNNLLKVKENV